METARDSTLILGQALARIGRLARICLGVEEAGITLGSESVTEAGATSGFQQIWPLHGRDGHLLGTLWLRDAAPREPFSASEHALLEDLAATAVAALEHQQDIAALALRERLLRLVVDAPSFSLAVDRAMAELRAATDSMLCLFFRLGPDGRHMHLVAGQASTPELTAAYLDHLRRIDVRVDNSLCGKVAASGEQCVVPRVDESIRRQYPAISLSVEQRIVSQIVTPLSLGEARYAFSVGFGPGPRVLPALAEMLMGLGSALRPLLRRLLDAEQIALNEQRFRLVAGATAEIVWDWDLDTGQVWWSEEMTRQFGHVVPEPLPGLGWWSRLVVPEEREAVTASRKAAIADTEPWQAEYRFRKADGSIALVSDRGFLLRDADGVGLRMVGSMVDITRQRALEEQLRQAQRLDALGNLTGGVAHDFNNLLAVIIGNAELMMEELALDDASRSNLEIILAAAERGADLTGRLLAFARLHPLAPKVVDVNRLLRNMEDLLRRLIGPPVEVAFSLSRGEAPAVIDGAQLENAVLNLCINARDAMPLGGRLRIATACLDRAALAEAGLDVPPGDYVVITVTDTGAGMPPEVASRAFEPFFTTKAFGKGSGLGLSMVFGFVSQSRGHVRIATEPGRGTAVTLYLPRSEQAPEVVEPEAPTVLASGRGRVLLVEDDASLRRTATAQLQRLGYEVLPAANGEAALEVLQRDASVDLLFTDIVMPGRLNGHQLARRAAALRPALRVLFTSGYQANAAPEPGDLDCGFLLLPKPYRLAELADAVRQLLDTAPSRSRIGQDQP
ncbi:PAS domain-containing protein [Roseomonas frigidaquae]|uniref:histidine kinase n=1 Tax=Falsiroseomonas frigidaquae TaxID=487318 RepID=A0ABX1ESA5_9PROT|nr:PAS domain-containing protein [Falsiroseomonas frigidaquae]